MVINFERILKECFWEYNFTPLEIQNLANSDNLREKKFLFEKILLNSSQIFKDLKIFQLEDLEYLIKNYQVPSFNKSFAFKRKNMAEVYFLNQPLLIEELQWIA